MKTSIKFILLFVFFMGAGLSLFIWRSTNLWQKTQTNIESEFSFAKMELSADQLRQKIELAQKIASQTITDKTRAQLETLSVEFIGEVFKEEGKWRLKWEGVISLDKNKDIGTIKSIPWSSLARSQPFWYNDKEGRIVWVKPLPSIDLHYLVIGFHRSVFPLLFSNVDTKHNLYAFSDFENQNLFLDNNWGWLSTLLAKAKSNQGVLTDSKLNNWYYYKMANLGLTLMTPYRSTMSPTNVTFALGIIALILLLVSTIIFSFLAQGVSKKISVVNDFLSGETDGSEVVEVSGSGELGRLASNALQFKKNLKLKPMILERKAEEPFGTQGIINPASALNSQSRSNQIVPVLKGVVFAVKPPIMSLLGFAKLGKEVDNIKESSEFFSAIRREAEHIKRFIDKLSNRELEVEGSENVLDLNESILLSIKSESDKSRRAQVRIEKKLGDGVNVFAASDALTQAVSELIKNAIEAAAQSDSPMVVINTGKIGTEVVMSIENSGPEVSNTAQFMEPFYTTKGDGHIGLGLTLVSELLKQQNAKLEFFIRASGGVKVNVTWPDAVTTMQEKRVRQLINRNEHTTEQQLLEIYRADQKASLGGKKPISGTELNSLPRLPTDSERLGLMKLKYNETSEDDFNQSENTNTAQTLSESYSAQPMDSTNTVQGRDVTLAATRTAAMNQPSETFFGDEHTNHERSVIFSQDTNLGDENNFKSKASASVSPAPNKFELEDNELTVGGLKIKFKNNKGVK